MTQTITPAEFAYRSALVKSAALLAPHRPGVAIQDLIAWLHNGVAMAIDPKPEAPPAVKSDPVVSARKSVTHDAVTCMHCGFVGKSLKRHLRAQHGQTPEQYREHWGLPATHPIVAPSYSERRSQLAKDNGLGKKP